MSTVLGSPPELDCKTSLLKTPCSLTTELEEIKLVLKVDAHSLLASFHSAERCDKAAEEMS